MKYKLLIAILIIIFSYLCLWPVEIEPIKWESQIDNGYVGPYKKNNDLININKLPLQGFTGPEDIAIDSVGKIYAATLEGIVRMEADGSSPKIWAKTNGRPLGIDFDNDGNLIVADAYRGLLSISAEAEVTLLTNSVEGKDIGFADDVAVASNGLIYFSDASSKFKPKDYNDVLKASELDVLEHGGNGKLLRYNPKTRSTDVLISGMNFANGVALSREQDFLLVNDMGNYQVLKYWIKGEKIGSVETILQNLPGFPDNVTNGLSGKFWISLIKPRNKDLDNLSSYPFLRKVATRLLPVYHPVQDPYAHIIAIDAYGKIIHNFQNPNPSYLDITTAKETEHFLYLGSLTEKHIGRISKRNLISLETAKD